MTSFSGKPENKTGLRQEVRQPRKVDNIREFTVFRAFTTIEEASKFALSSNAEIIQTPWKHLPFIVAVTLIA